MNRLIRRFLFLLVIVSLSLLSVPGAFAAWENYTPVPNWKVTYQNAQLKDGYGIQKGSNGRVYIKTDLSSSSTQVVMFNDNGTYIGKFGSYGTGDGQFKLRGGLVLDQSDNVYIADEENDRVVKFSSTGTYITSWGQTGTGTGEFDTPTNVYYANDTIYVMDGGNNRIQGFTTSGVHTITINMQLVELEIYTKPKDMVIASDGYIYVAASAPALMNRIEKYSSSGVFVENISEGYPWTFDVSKMTIDSEDNLYVIDTNSCIQIISLSGNSQGYIDEWDDANYDLLNPSDIF